MPIDALLLLFNSINAMRQQIRPDARINGIVTHGGVAANIIPDYAVGRFYLRAKTRAYLTRLWRISMLAFRLQWLPLAPAPRYRITRAASMRW